MTIEVTTPLEELDIVIIGGGISGIGAAATFRRDLPGKSLAVLEARDSIGGTWDLFRYPGIRSDSDLHTFGYEFKPWRHEQAIADAPLILDYLRETVEQHGLTDLVRTGHRVLGAQWSSQDSAWTLQVERTVAGTREVVTLRTRWVFRGDRLLPLGRGLRADLRGCAGLRRHDRAPAALA